MKDRSCEHFIDTYMEYTRQSECPDSFHQWCAMSMIAAVLRRQVWVDMGYFRVYPNMYIVLVAPAGRARKTVAISTATALLDDLTDIRMSADSTTREALIQVLKASEQTTTINNAPYVHSSLTIVSKELSVFLGQSNHDLLSLLTDLYDNPNKWEYRTKTQGIDDVINVWLNMLAASTPDWLVGSVPSGAIGGGFTSRVIFVVEYDARKRVPRPQLTDYEKQLKVMLKRDLEKMSMISGEFHLTKEAVEYFDQWYLGKDDTLLDDKRFWGYFERKHIHLLKVATILAVADGSKDVINDLHLRQALYMLDSLEERMMGAFGGAGRSREALDIDTVIEVIKIHRRISRKGILKYIWRDVPLENVDMVLKAIIDMGEVDVEVDKEGITWYKVKE